MLSCVFFCISDKYCESKCKGHVSFLQNLHDDSPENQSALSKITFIPYFLFFRWFFGTSPWGASDAMQIFLAHQLQDSHQLSSAGSRAHAGITIWPRPFSFPPRMHVMKNAVTLFFNQEAMLAPHHIMASTLCIISYESNCADIQ